MAEVNDKGKQKILIHNHVFSQIQKCTEDFKETTGEIIYSNKYTNIGEVPIGDLYKEALNSDLGENGNNLLEQLLQKVQQFPDGPWEVDRRDGIVYIHNRKLNEPSRVVYTYQGGNGELLSVNFETQLIVKTIQAHTTSGITSNKGFYQGYGVVDQSNTNRSNTNYLYTASDFYSESNGSYKPQSAVNAYCNGKLSYSDLMYMNERVKVLRNTHRSTFTESQWKRIKAHRELEIKQSKESYRTVTENRYKEYKSHEINDPSYNRRKAVQETLQNKDLTQNVMNFLKQVHLEASGQVYNELAEAARNGTLQSLLKSRYSGINYTFTTNNTDGSASVYVYDVKNVNIHSKEGVSIFGIGDQYHRAQRDPRIKVLSNDIARDSSIRIFGRFQESVEISAIELLKAHFQGRTSGASNNRRGGYHGDYLSNNATGNRIRRVTERKLNARAKVVGRPSLKSGQVITINNVGKRWSGDWYIKTCTHEIDPNSGYITQLELIKHNGEVGVHTATKHEQTNHSSSISRSKGTGSSNSNGSINFTDLEIAQMEKMSQADRADVIALKLAGVKDAITPKGRVVNAVSSDLDYGINATPQQLQQARAKYGRAATDQVRKMGKDLKGKTRIR